jgi:hypothetical protein
LEADAQKVETAMAGAFAAAQLSAKAYRAPVASEGVKVIAVSEELVAA